MKNLVDKCLDAPVKSLVAIDSSGSTLLHSLVNQIESTSNDLKKLLKKHPSNDVKALLMAPDKSKATILHVLASAKNGHQKVSHQTLWEILQESLLETNHRPQILMQRNGKGDNIIEQVEEEDKLSEDYASDA